MRWLDTPPCAPMDVTEASAARVRLTGPAASSRLTGGFAAAAGTAIAGVGLRLLRLPIPGPARLVPLAFTAVGGGVAALGAVEALSSCSLEATREGLTVRWKVPLREERTLQVPATELAALEVTTHHFEGAQQVRFGRGVRTYEFRLVAVTRDGRAIELETFATRAQAALRQQVLGRALGLS
jgi:hypothetical protein